MIMKRMITVAAVQMEIAPLDTGRNLAKIEKLVGELCNQQPVDLVVLPEDVLTGPIPYNLEYALSESSSEVTRLCQIAREKQLYLAAGSFICKDGDNYYNTALLIDPSGEIQLRYRKNHLWIPERRYLVPGNEAMVVDTPIGKIGLAICWDLAFPELFRSMIKQGAEIICIPSYWSTGGNKPADAEIKASKMMIDTLCLARALENECLIIYANGAGKAKYYVHGKIYSENQVGHSQICAPFYGTVAKISSNREGYIVYTYDRNIAERAEVVNQLRADISRM